MPETAGEAPRSALTSREEQVLELVAEGLTNGQIAERLYISVKTVSVHVSAILRKLEAPSPLPRRSTAVAPPDAAGPTSGCAHRRGGRRAAPGPDRPAPP